MFENHFQHSLETLAEFKEHVGQIGAFHVKVGEFT